MFDPNADRSPFNPVPPVIVFLALAIILIEVVLQLGSRGLIGGPSAIGWRLSLIEQFGLSGRMLEYMYTTDTYNFGYIGRFLSYPFLHYALSHAAFAAVMILALGKMVAESFHTISVIILFVACTISGAIAYGMIDHTLQPFIGAFPVVYGLLGAYTWMLWQNAAATGESGLTAFRLIGFLVVLQFIFRIVIPFITSTEPPLPNAWISDLAGFITGFLLSFVLAPDGRIRMKRWLTFLRRR
ncbi:MAG: rhomboid family intramembrane serine protease [Paracoccaceae bacterium]